MEAGAEQETSIRAMQRGKGIFEACMKTCITCANPCANYFNSIAQKCWELLGQEQTELRQYIASVCPDYKQAKPQFTHYSNGEPYLSA